MSSPPLPHPVAADACFLINFLVVDRMDLLGALRSRYRFHVPLEVFQEVLRPDEVRRLNEALASDFLEALEIVDLTELTTYADLLHEGIGSGESACLAVDE